MIWIVQSKFTFEGILPFSLAFVWDIHLSIEQEFILNAIRAILNSISSDLSGNAKEYWPVL